MAQYLLLSAGTPRPPSGVVDDLGEERGERMVHRIQTVAHLNEMRHAKIPSRFEGT